jgi:hypothetical protein
MPDDGRLERARAWFQQIRTAGPGSLPQFSPITIEDESLTRIERSAVGRAVAAPDICLVAADAPSAGRIARATAREAAVRGERVLLLAEADSRRARLEELRPVAAAVRGRRWWSLTYWQAEPDAVGKFDRLLQELTVAEPPGLTVCPPDKLHSATGRWDRLICLNSDRLTEADATALAARADRWVFLGAAGNAGWWSDMRTLLADETWVREGDRLRCRLRHDADQSQLSSEPVADTPDVELRFDRASELAEVVFSADTTLFAAKNFLAEQMEAWPIDLDAQSITWDESAERIIACAGCGDRPTAIPREVEPGIRELIADRTGSLPWFTYGIEFDRSEGWNRTSAEAWLAGRFPAVSRVVTV